MSVLSCVQWAQVEPKSLPSLYQTVRFTVYHLQCFHWSAYWQLGAPGNERLVFGSFPIRKVRVAIPERGLGLLTHERLAQELFYSGLKELRTPGLTPPSSLASAQAWNMDRDYGTAFRILDAFSYCSLEPHQPCCLGKFLAKLLWITTRGLCALFIYCVLRLRKVTCGPQGKYPGTPETYSRS